MFNNEICKIFKKTFFQGTPSVVACAYIPNLSCIQE